MGRHICKGKVSGALSDTKGFPTLSQLQCPYFDLLIFFYLVGSRGCRCTCLHILDRRNKNRRENRNVGTTPSLKLGCLFCQTHTNDQFFFHLHCWGKLEKKPHILVRSGARHSERGQVTFFTRLTRHKLQANLIKQYWDLENVREDIKSSGKPPIFS